MIDFIRKKLIFKLVIFFLLVALIPIATIGYLSSGNTGQALRITAGMTIIVAIMAILLARTVANPIADMTERVTRASRGDLTVIIPDLKRTDELGVLASGVGRVVNNLRRGIKQTLDGVDILAESASQISNTMSQVAAAISETSAGVAQATATVEQVRQAARMTRERARKVADSSKQVVQVSETGKDATDHAILKINLIKDQMECIGEIVIRLSEHGQTIGQIIDTVQDIAEQSNILAVNASIEAARPGDHGAGFAVVASEIKSLAGQSKKATEQVRDMLQDTRKWVTAVVMATEEGGKAVTAGVAQSAIAGEVIRSLSDVVVTASKEATVIDSSSELQFVGVEQVAEAMSSIEHAMNQNQEGTRQLEEAARRLENLGQELKNMVGKVTI